MNRRSQQRSQQRRQHHQQQQRRTEPRPHITPVSPAQPKRRLRSRTVIIGSIGALFAGLCMYGVFRDEKRTCVDNQNQVIRDDDCERGSSGARWYYGGSNVNGKMKDGSFVRGGFGGRTSGGS